MFPTNRQIEILNILLAGEINVREIARKLKSSKELTANLKALRHMKLIRMRQQKNRHYYSLTPTGFTVAYKAGKAEVIELLRRMRPTMTAHQSLELVIIAHSYLAELRGNPGLRDSYISVRTETWPDWKTSAQPGSTWTGPVLNVKPYDQVEEGASCREIIILRAAKNPELMRLLTGISPDIEDLILRGRQPGWKDPKESPPLRPAT
jgi:DNA-binding transcriptional ArsR family regulator